MKGSYARSSGVAGLVSGLFGLSPLSFSIHLHILSYTCVSSYFRRTISTFAIYLSKFYDLVTNFKKGRGARNSGVAGVYAHPPLTASCVAPGCLVSHCSVALWCTVERCPAVDSLVQKSHLSRLPPTIATSDTGEMQHTATHCNTYCNTALLIATSDTGEVYNFPITLSFLLVLFVRCLWLFLVHVFLSKASAVLSYQPLLQCRGCASRTFGAAMDLRIASHCNTPHHTATHVHTATSAKHSNTLVDVRRGDYCTAPVEATHGFRCCVAFEGCTLRCNMLAR